jgi:hypothetical protein
MPAVVPLWKVNRRRPHVGEPKPGPQGPGFLLRRGFLSGQGFLSNQERIKDGAPPFTISYCQ